MADSPANTPEIAPGGPSNPRVDGGRDPKGRFQPGNRCGRGSPLAGQVAKLRAALLKGVTAADMRDVIAALLVKAKAGDVAAVRVVLSYTIGEPVAFDFVERLNKLENLLLQKS